MNCGFRAGAVLVGAVWLLACSEGSSRNENAPGGDLSKKTVRVVFDLPGDDIGGGEAQRILQDMKDEIQKKSTATVVSSGFGMGTLEIVLRYEGGYSIKELRGMIGGIYPKAKYRIDPTSN